LTGPPAVAIAAEMEGKDSFTERKPTKMVAIQKQTRDFSSFVIGELIGH